MSEETDKKKFAWEWSAKHTRLRYQLVVLALLFASFCRFDTTSFQLPLSIAEFSEKPAQWEFVLGVLLFYVFTLVSFYYRSSNEKNSRDVSNEHFFILGRELEKKLSTFSEIIDKFGEKNFSELDRNIKLFEKELKNVEAKYSVKHDAFHDPLSVLSDLQIRIESDLKLIVNYEDTLNVYSNQPTAGGYETRGAPPSPVVLNSNKLNEWIGLLDYSLPILAELSSSTLVPRLVSSNANDEVKVVVNQMSQVAFLEQQRLDQLKLYLANDGPVAFQNLKLEIKKLNRDSEKRLNYNRIDRELLGYWLPIVVSGVIILIGTWFITGPNNTLSN